MTAKQIEAIFNEAGISVDGIRKKSKYGSKAFEAYKSYFYHNGLSPDSLFTRIHTSLAGKLKVKYITGGDHYHHFVGGAKSGSSKDSYIYVIFQVVE